MFDKRVQFSASVENIIFWCVFLAATIFLVSFFQYAEPYSHDWEYPYKLDKLGVFGFLYEHYMTVNGRIPMHWLMGLIGDNYPLWIVLHALILCAFPVAILGLAGIEKVQSFRGAAAIVLFIGLLLNFSAPYFYIGLSWLTGSLNYVWPTIAAVSLIFCFRYFSHGKAHNILLIVWAFIIGFSHEQIAILGLGLLICAICWSKLKKRDSTSIWLLLFALLAGAAVLFLAPGNQVRLEGGPYSIGDQVRHNMGPVLTQWLTDDIYSLLHLFLLSMSIIISSLLALRLKEFRGYFIVACVLLLLALGYFFAGKYSLVSSDTKLLSMAIQSIPLLFFGGLLAACRNSPYAFVLYLAAIASQLLLLFIPAIGFRTSMPTLLLLVAVVIVLYGELMQLLGAKILFALLAVALLLITPGIKEFYKLKEDYKSNSVVWDDNRSRINVWRQDKNKRESEPLVLKKLPGKTAHWEMPYQNANFSEYFFHAENIPQDATVVWEGTSTDDRQRLFIDNALRSPDGGAVKQGMKEVISGRFSDKGDYCKVYSDGNYIAFSYNVWGCGGRHMFKISVGAKPGVVGGWYKGILRRDKYMLTVHNWPKPSVASHVYTIDSENGPKPQHVDVEWLGKKVRIR